LLCFIWGSSFILMKVSNQGMTPYQVAGLRIFSAALVFIPFSIFHLQEVSRKIAGLLVITGFFGNLLPAFCFAIALVKIDSSLTGVLNSLTPICVVLTGILIFKDKIKRQKILGVIIGFAGLCLLTLTQSDISLNNAGYSSLVILGTLSYGINVNLVGHYLKSIRPLHIATISLAFMSVPAALVLWQQEFLRVDFSNSTVQWSLINCLLLGIVGTAFGTVLFYLLVQKAGGLFASLVTYGIPFVALFWGFLDGEKTSWVEMLCLAIILSGVYLANRRERKTGQFDLEKSN
jgi:drug/metabolite transporter (DMT)-like permease